MGKGISWYIAKLPITSSRVSWPHLHTKIFAFLVVIFVGQSILALNLCQLCRYGCLETHQPWPKSNPYCTYNESMFQLNQRFYLGMIILRPLMQCTLIVSRKFFDEYKLIYTLNYCLIMKSNFGKNRFSFTIMKK